MLLSLWRQVVDEKFIVGHLPRLSDVSTFSWHAPYTFLSHVYFLPISTVVYLITIFSIQRLMKSRKPFRLQKLITLHNVILCIWSLLMFIGGLNGFVQIYQRQGFSRLFCTSASEVAQGELVFWTWVYYLSKFYELLDTVIVVLRKTRLTFLHVFHHSVVIYMVYSWLEAHLVFHGWAMLANTFIHVFMYYYYARCSMGRKWISIDNVVSVKWNRKRYVVEVQQKNGKPKIFTGIDPSLELKNIIQRQAKEDEAIQKENVVVVRGDELRKEWKSLNGQDSSARFSLQTFSPFWKSYLTWMQIFQFAVSFLLSGQFVYYFVKYDGDCVGVDALLFTLVCNFVFLLLFSRFYVSTYMQSKVKTQ